MSNQVFKVLQAFTQPGDKVLITTPVYPPFINVPHRSGRVFVSSPLKTVNRRFAIDYNDLEEKAKGCKVMILANPHNPGGTVWTKEELQKIAAICYRQKVLVIADEIHADLTLPSFTHTSFSTVSEEALHNSITFIAPSKTFNMAGLASSVCYVPDADIKKQFFGFLDANELSLGTLFAYVAAEAAERAAEAEKAEETPETVTEKAIVSPWKINTTKDYKPEIGDAHIEAKAELGGKGGGSDAMIQGSVTADEKTVRDFFGS